MKEIAKLDFFWSILKRYQNKKPAPLQTKGTGRENPENAKPYLRLKCASKSITYMAFSQQKDRLVLIPNNRIELECGRFPN